MTRISIAISALLVLIVSSVIAALGVPSADAQAAAAPPFALLTRSDKISWPAIQPWVRPGDVIWGSSPALLANNAFNFPNYARLVAMPDSKLAKFSSVNQDGEYAVASVALAEAPMIRAFIDAYNRRHPTAPLKWVAFFHLVTIDAVPSIVGYPDVVVFGKSQWVGSQIVKNAQPYVSLIRQHGRTPGVVLGNCSINGQTGQKTYYTAGQVLTNFHAVIDPAPAGLGLNVVGFYYDLHNYQTLVSALSSLR